MHRIILGFLRFTRTGLTLALSQVARVDLVLQVGDITQSIVVQENVAMMQTDRPESNTVMTTTQFDRLPLIQQNRMRNPVFVYMTPRVQGNYVPDGSNNVGATTQIRFGGGQQFESEATVDGIVGGRTQLTGSITEAAPPVDAVREFKVTNSLMSAEWGHTGIGLVGAVARTLRADLQCVQPASVPHVRFQFQRQQLWPGSRRQPPALHAVGVADQVLT